MQFIHPLAKNKPLGFIWMMLLVLMLTGCGSGEVPAEDYSNLPLRDNTPQVLVPKADGAHTIESDVALIDDSHSDQGYVMVKYHGQREKVRLQILTPEQITYTYTLSPGVTDTFPLTGGSGTYQLTVFENIQGDQYSTGMMELIDVTLADEFHTYLYPNQYVNFAPDDQIISLAESLSDGTHVDLEVVTNVYNYVKDNITYDTQKAETVENGYLPVVDDILQKKTGICFDYAAVMASMLRSQGIPTRLDVGYTGSGIYHAWVSVYLKEQGWVDGIIEFNGNEWTLMDPTLASSTKKKKLKKYMGDGTNYVLKYVY